MIMSALDPPRSHLTSQFFSKFHQSAVGFWPGPVGFLWPSLTTWHYLMALSPYPELSRKIHGQTGRQSSWIEYDVFLTETVTLTYNAWIPKRSRKTIPFYFHSDCLSFSRGDHSLVSDSHSGWNPPDTIASIAKLRVHMVNSMAYAGYVELDIFLQIGRPHDMTNLWFTEMVADTSQTPVVNSIVLRPNWGWPLALPWVPWSGKLFRPENVGANITCPQPVEPPKPRAASRPRRAAATAQDL